jgi:hypothetical protein
MGSAFALAALLELVHDSPAEVRRDITEEAMLDALAVEFDERHVEGLDIDRRLDELERRYIARRRERAL